MTTWRLILNVEVDRGDIVDVYFPDTHHHPSIDALTERIGFTIDHRPPQTEPFEYRGVTITDPTLDETGRFEVGPDYYPDRSTHMDYTDYPDDMPRPEHIVNVKEPAGLSHFGTRDAEVLCEALMYLADSRQRSWLMSELPAVYARWVNNQALRRANTLPPLVPTVVWSRTPEDAV